MRQNSYTNIHDQSPAQTTTTSQTTQASSNSTSPRPETPSELAFEYEYLDLLGEGANGKTWLARQRRTGDLVAVKALKFSGDPKQLELFAREAATLQTIDVRGVPKFHKSILPDDPGAPCYIIQQYIPHQSIQSVLDKGNIFTEAQTIKLLKSITLILQALQSYSPPIIHRDIKPSNVLYDPQNLREAYLIDFGAVANPQKLNNGSTIAGTFGYMAPEQMLGTATLQSDFYALGALAIHMLTGVAPTNIPSDVFQLNFTPVIQNKAPNTSESMVRLLLWMTHPNAEKRPQNARFLFKALNAVQDDHFLSPEQLVDLQEKQNLPAQNQPEGFFARLIARFQKANIQWKTTEGRVYHIQSTVDQDEDFQPDASERDYNVVNGIVVMNPQKPPVCQFPAYSMTTYVFEVNGRTYLGSCLLSSVPQAIPPDKLPITTTVYYCAEDPRINHILSLSKD